MKNYHQESLIWWKNFVRKHRIKNAALFASEPFPDGARLYRLEFFSGYGAVNGKTYEVIRRMSSPVPPLYGGFDKAACEDLMRIVHEAIAAVFPGEKSSLKRRHLEYAAKGE
jgi:hypothetical protein